jgi:type IV pilus assembly protein PilB
MLEGIIVAGPRHAPKGRPMRNEAMRDALGILVSIDSGIPDGYEVVATRKMDKDTYELVLAKSGGKGRKTTEGESPFLGSAFAANGALFDDSVFVLDTGQPLPPRKTTNGSAAAPASATWVVKSPRKSVTDETGLAVPVPAGGPTVQSDVLPPAVNAPVVSLSAPTATSTTPPSLDEPVTVIDTQSSNRDGADGERDVASASVPFSFTDDGEDDVAPGRTHDPNAEHAHPLDLAATAPPSSAATSEHPVTGGRGSEPAATSHVYDLVADEHAALAHVDPLVAGAVPVAESPAASPVVRVAPREVVHQSAQPDTARGKPPVNEVAAPPTVDPTKSKRPPAAPEPKAGPAHKAKDSNRRMPFSRAKEPPKAVSAPPAPAPIRAPSSAGPRAKVEIDPRTGRPTSDPLMPLLDARARTQNASDGSVIPANDSGKNVKKSRHVRLGGANAEPDVRVPTEFQTHLVETGRVTDEQLDAAFERHLKVKEHIFVALDDLGVMSEDDIATAVSEFYHLSVCDLPRQEMDASALDLVPEKVARDHMAFPISTSPEGLFVAVAEPSERLAGLLTQASGQTVLMAISTPTNIQWAIDSNYHALAGVAELVEEFEAGEGFQRRSTSSAVTELADESAPIVRVVNRILSQAMRDGASDVHIEPADDIVRVRNRVDGVLKVVLVLPGTMGVGLVSRIKIMADMNIVERRRPQDGKFTVMIDEKEVDVRVATVATIWGETCVMRILDKSRSVLSIDDLGMTTTTHEAYSKLIRSPFGMVLCVGPTGSGKTTTLYASLTEISDVARNVMTIEDPVEYVFPSINQIQTNEQAGLTFATGLKSILRQDSDIVLVGEIRDVETARIAVQSTLTGHFVLSSLHATDAISALTRFIDMGIESFLIASSVIAIVGQRLVRRTCTECKVPYEPTEEEMAFYRDGGGPEKTVFYHGVGCNFCGQTGFKERIGVYELFPMTSEMKRLIVGFATEDELRDLARKQGMRSIKDEAISLIANDLTTSAEVVRSIYSI